MTSVDKWPILTGMIDIDALEKELSGLSEIALDSRATRYSQHEAIKAQVWAMGCKLGYYSVMEAPGPEHGSKNHQRVDVAWYKGKQLWPEVVFEVQRLRVGKNTMRKLKGFDGSIRVCITKNIGRDECSIEQYEEARQAGILLFSISLRRWFT